MAIQARPGGRIPHKWSVLSNTTLGMLMATVNASILIISLPAIFRGIHLDPLAPGNVSYLLWMLMGYLLVTAVLVVSLGRLGDMFGRVKIYNAGFAVFAFASVACLLTPGSGRMAALWLIGWRIVQGVGGAMLMANSTAIITDTFPARQRGTALGVNQVAGLAGSFVGLVLGGLLSAWHWRSIFGVSALVGVIGAVWAYRNLRETVVRRSGVKIDWWGNATLAVGLTVLLAALTYGIQPYGDHVEGWANPLVFGGLIAGAALLVAFCVIETRVAQPMFHLRLFKIQAFWAGNSAALFNAIARGGLQFMLIIWLQGIWLPLRGYDFEDTPLWAGIYLVPLTIGFIVAGPLSGYLSDRYGAKLLATGGLVVMALTFVGLLLIPVNFSYPLFAILLFFNGAGSGLFSAPNTTAVMNAVPAGERGVASGIRATFQNAGMVLSIGLFFSLLIAGLSSSLPSALHSGLTAQGVPASAVSSVVAVPPVSLMFAAFLGTNPIGSLLDQAGVTGQVPPSTLAHLTDRTFLPGLLSGPFHDGLLVVFILAAALAAAGAVVSLFRGGVYIHEDATAPATAAPSPTNGRGSRPTGTPSGLPAGDGAAAITSAATDTSTAGAGNGSAGGAAANPPATTGTSTAGGGNGSAGGADDAPGGDDRPARGRPVRRWTRRG
ncbi:putative MFS family arabinose efflux permease [Asanoa ferruginea]|uniref:Putative MFS family arabinose efflux permease n=1 Tax=Asanoa ferruginea TaxID=53367 RepID=A0A3D9ZWY5_9ACTN|nr:MFS transporter [Asanoa ferruginea]REG01737.1 putative MFS family arabinose efflux permease [Asanoa ferruginea]GIF49230.1 putative major facilitator superfamily protein [Asanoa ferruginea]